MILDFCPICTVPREHDILPGHGTGIPDWAVCTRCGNGFALDEETA